MQTGQPSKNLLRACVTAGCLAEARKAAAEPCNICFEVVRLSQFKGACCWLAQFNSTQAVCLLGR
jgi:hypothetical protein